MTEHDKHIITLFFSIVGGIVLWIVFILTCGVISGFGQTAEKECDHVSDSLERFANIRLLPPATITSYNAATGELHYRVDTRREIKLGSFIVERDTQTDKAFKSGEFKGKLFWVLYCYADGHLYIVQEIDKGKVVTVKK